MLPSRSPELAPVTLAGAHVTLVPLLPAHLPALLRVATDPREAYPYTTVGRTEATLAAYIGTALADQARGMALPFTTIASGGYADGSEAGPGTIVGSTRFANIERWAWEVGSPGSSSPVGIDAVEIGWTWLSPDAQRTGINTEAKLLMLTYAFETWGVRRVTLKTDRRNERSRAAIGRLGFRLDGVMRAHGPGWDGLERDAAFFSLLSDEWPEAKARLAARLRR
ncbi:MAG: GNAT family protein [Pseudomonadota bacterium]|nr:GNAT family protein [Pseudomonadota bacterium]